LAAAVQVATAFTARGRRSSARPWRLSLTVAVARRAAFTSSVASIAVAAGVSAGDSPGSRL
jgi:hypothetical protein